MKKFTWNARAVTAWLGVTIGLAVSANAQQVSWGNALVNTGQILLQGSHSFMAGGSGLQPGIIKSNRPAASVGFGAASNASVGIVAFGPSATHTGASDGAHVDGYVAKYTTTASITAAGAEGVSFTYPIGDGKKFRPATLQIRTPGMFTAGYNAQDPTKIVAKLESKLGKISNVEYWDISSGTADYGLTLTWDAASGLSALTGNDLSKLVIAGFNKDTRQWESVGVTETTGSLGSAGTIRHSGFRAQNYLAYTFGVLSIGVPLNIRVLLQGPAALAREFGMSSPMTNFLQVPDPFISPKGILPVNDCYEGTNSYSRINDPNGPAGEVVDWIKVDVIDAGKFPVVIRQTKNLLLNTNGYIREVDGTLPIFSTQTTPVQIVVRHRNHLPVVTKVINSLVAPGLDYDFTTSLAQAYTEGGPPQLVQITPGATGAWHMIGGTGENPRGGTFTVYDGNNMVVDGTDITDVQLVFEHPDYGKYIHEDLNLDGIVDGLDRGIVLSNSGSLASGTSYFSFMYNYY